VYKGIIISTVCTWVDCIEPRAIRKHRYCVRSSFHPLKGSADIPKNQPSHPLVLEIDLNVRAQVLYYKLSNSLLELRRSLMDFLSFRGIIVLRWSLLKPIYYWLSSSETSPIFGGQTTTLICFAVQCS
jgi:hypothetical protein